jgi:hypothetical protein
MHIMSVSDTEQTLHLLKFCIEWVITYFSYDRVLSWTVENFKINLLGPQKVGKFVDELSDYKLI